MDFKILFLGLIICNTQLLGQIGINTDNPKGIFHVDSKNNNSRSETLSESEVLDDFIILPNGNIGLGIVNPEHKIDIKTGGTIEEPISGLRIQDGTQGLGKVLTSDVNGVAKWENPKINLKVGVVASATNGKNLYFKGSSSPSVFPFNTNAYIDLPPGKWKITTTQLFAMPGGNCTLTVDDWFVVHTTFSKSATSMTEQARIAGTFQGPKTSNVTYKYDLLQGSMIVNNTADTTQRYYYLVTDIFENYTLGSGKCQYFLNFGGDFQENIITAYLISN